MLKYLWLTLLALTGTVALVAQEGHPMSGTWHGEWKQASGQTGRIVLSDDSQSLAQNETVRKAYLGEG